jgi:hypothetical protein
MTNVHIPGYSSVVKCRADGSTIGDGCAICRSIGRQRCPDHYQTAEPDADIVLADGERFDENNLFPGETPNEVR